MTRIGILLLVATTMGTASPVWSQDHGGDRADRGNGAPPGNPNGGGHHQGGGPVPTATPAQPRPDMRPPGQPAMQPPRPPRDDAMARPAPGMRPDHSNGPSPNRDPNVQRPPQGDRGMPAGRPGFDHGNGYDRGDGDDRGGGNYSHNRPPPGNYWRPDNSRPSSNYWNNNRWNNRPVYAPAYRYPRGYGYRQWSPGLILPSLFLGSSYYFDGYFDLGLSAPPYGYRWVRYGPDLLLVNVRSGRIRDVRYGVFG